MNIQEFADKLLKNTFERWKKQYPEQANITFIEWRKNAHICIERDVNICPICYKPTGSCQHTKG